MIGPLVTLGDMHICPMTTGPVPHVGGPVVAVVACFLISCKTVLLTSELCTCVGPPDSASQSNGKFMIKGMAVVTLGCISAHGGTFIVTQATVIIASAA